MIEALTPLSFGDFPDDVQLCVLSFLRPAELAAFACTCKRFDALHRHDQRLWFSLCHRRWGSKTLINKWGGGKISYKHLYRVLDEYDSLIGFWRLCGGEVASSPPLVFFEWGPFYITGSRVSPSRNSGYGVIKKPFLWLSIAPNGKMMNYLDPDGRVALTEEDLMSESGVVESELIRTTVSFIGECHVVVEENLGVNSSGRDSDLRGEECDSIYGSPPDRLVTEIYQYFANRTSPGGNGSPRRLRRREKEKQGRMKKWEPEHFVKIVTCSPTTSRPLQGLWKGICNDKTLEFYLVTYDDVGGIACRKIGDSNRPPTYHAPIFWTSSLTFIEFPFSRDENDIYNSRLHLRPPAEADRNHDHVSLSSDDDDAVSRMLYINSSYDLVLPDRVGNTANPRWFEGRIWQYYNGTFGFGFLRDNYIIDMKHIAIDGRLLDTVEPNIG